jgi:hypothetical protein
MKQSISVFVLFILILSLAPASFGQKGALLKEKTLAKQTVKPIQPVQQAPEVVIATPEAFTDGNGVFLRWRTESETGNLGFYVTRIDKDEKHRVGRFISGSAMHYGNETAYGEEYSLFDRDGQADSQYIIESFLTNGAKVSTDPLSAKYTADLSSVAGATSKQLALNQLLTNSVVTSDTPVSSKDLQYEMDINSKSADLAKQSFIAAQPGAKIAIRQTGMYRVTKTQMQAAGFDVNSDPTKWQLYVNGNEQSITVGPNANYIEFFARGIDAAESDTAVYYLIAGSSPGKRISSFALRPSFRANSAVSFVQDSTMSQRNSYVPDFLNGPASNFFGDPVTQSQVPTSESFTISGIDTSASSVHLIIKFQGYWGGTHTLNVVLNGQTVGQVSSSGPQPFVFDAMVPTSALIEGQNTLQFPSLSSGDGSLFVSVEVVYQKKYLVNQNQLQFTATSDLDTQLQGFSSSNVRVFDITHDGDPVQITGLIVSPNGNTFDASIPAYKNALMYSVEDSGLLTPASITLNSPSTLSTPSHTANMVIISYKDFMTQANAWADYRRNQGISVEVVNVEDVFDEFNYGSLSSESLKDFLFYAKNNWQTPPQYVLLIGDGTYDPRDYEGRGFADYIPTMLVDTPGGETASDDAIVDFNNDGLAEIAIGRIPARTTAMVTNALSKTMSFESQVALQNLSRGVIFAYDNPIGYDFQAMSQRLAATLPSGTQSVLVARNDANPNPTLISEMNNGRYLVNFSGHGTTGSWASPSNFQIGHVPLLTNSNSLSIYTMLTCLNGYFANTTNVSLGEVLLNASNGGAVASWASSGTTTPDIQELMATRFYTKIGEGNITRLGDLIVDAKSVVPGGRDVRLSWVLLGDPMLKTR